jgi:hypothetical protein
MRNLLALSMTILLAIAGCGDREPAPVAKPSEHSRAKVEFDRRELMQSLQSLEAWHRASATGWAEQAFEGTSRAAIVERFEGQSFVICEELLALWGWHDGSRAKVPMLLDFHLLSSSESAARFAALREDSTIPWRHNWIPVLEADGRWLLVESSRRSAPAGPVVAFRKGETPQVVFTNLTRLLQTMAAAIGDSSAIWIEADARMEIPEEELRRIHGLHHDPNEFPESMLDRR